MDKPHLGSLPGGESGTRIVKSIPLKLFEDTQDSETWPSLCCPARASRKFQTLKNPGRAGVCLNEIRVSSSAGSPRGAKAFFLSGSEWISGPLLENEIPPPQPDTKSPERRFYGGQPLSSCLLKTVHFGIYEHSEGF